jgi:hypothetical protein
LFLTYEVSMKNVLASQVEECLANVKRLSKRLKGIDRIGREGAKASLELANANLRLRKVLQLDLAAFVEDDEPAP